MNYNKSILYQQNIQLPCIIRFNVSILSNIDRVAFLARGVHFHLHKIIHSNEKKLYQLLSNR